MLSVFVLPDIVRFLVGIVHILVVHLVVGLLLIV